ncbi:MAG: Gfo/Idh/MocA family oxidoreductase [Alphaproteobacteria bacterium]|nr:Gfo/Idh/MocA family oxidoreductase [Alphaproteobacteria bacterium]
MVCGAALVGCGYVADLYFPTFQNWREKIRLEGAYDNRPDRLGKYCTHYGLHAYTSLEEVLQDDKVSIVLNLTNPDQHYEISRRCLLAGKHVYSEKPLAMELDQSRELVELAASKGLHIASAPSTVLAPSAQAMWKALRHRTVGEPRLVYAELDDGMVHRIGYENWVTATGAKWPARDEFQTGCTLEHAGYALTWLVAMFGPVRRVVSASSCQITDKGSDTPPSYTTPDFSVACLYFDNGLCARLTNSIIAPHDHRFRVFCDDGILSVDEVWDVLEPVKESRVLTDTLSRGIKKLTGWQRTRRHTTQQPGPFNRASRGFPIDFALGPAEMADAISKGREPRLGGKFALHITEVSLAIQHPERFGADYTVTTDCPPMAPMDWGTEKSVAS